MLKGIHKFAIFVIGALSSVLATSAPEKAWVLRVHVLDVSDFPVPESGLMKTWISISVMDDNASTSMNLLLVYVAKSQAVPRVGEHCAFTVHKERAGGFVGSSRVDTYDAIVIEKFSCDGPAGTSG